MYRANNPSAPRMDFSKYSDVPGGGFDSHTTVSYRRNAGYFENVGNSCMGIFIGLLIVLIAFPVLFFNEGRAVRTARSLDEGLNNVVSLKSPQGFHDDNNGKLVHFYGPLRTELALTDSDFGISVQAVKLRRSVDMYQWVEHEHKREYNEGDRTRVETTYSYTREWRSEVVNSGRFNLATTHQNPNAFPISATEKVAGPVYVGSFHLSQGLIGKVDGYEDIQLAATPAHRTDLKLLENYFYRAQDPYKPQVGELRIKFSYAGLSGEALGQQKVVSIIAQQNGLFLTAHQTKAGDSLEILYPDAHSAEEIFALEQSSNTALTWFLRLVGWLLMFVGLQVSMSVFRQIVSFVPILRDVVGLATSVIAFTFATSLALLTIAAGWLRYRPLLACSIILAASVPVVLSRYKGKKQKGDFTKE